MTRAAAAALLAWLGAAEAGRAADAAECRALLARMGWTAEVVTAPAGACFLQGVAPEEGAWRARIVALHGDVDALPDAPPSRLTGGVWGLAWGEGPELTATLDMASGGGVVRIDRLGLRAGRWRGDLSARIEGVPEVWPAGPGALDATRLASLEGAVWTEEEAEGGAGPGFDAGPWIAALARGGGATAAAAARAAEEAGEGASGRLDLTLGEAGLAARAALPLLRGGLDPDEAAALAAEAGLALDWMPDEASAADAAR